MARKRQTGTNAPDLQISREEQLRLIEQTGILNKVPTPDGDHEPTPGSTRPRADQEKEEEEEEEYPLAEEIFAATTLLVPMSFLLLMMYILVHFQYGQHPSWDVISGRMLSGVPILALFIFFSEDGSHLSPSLMLKGVLASRYKHTRWIQASFVVLSVASGTRMIYHVNHSNWQVTMQQCPPLGTIWVYTILQLDLGPAVLALCAVGVWVRWTGARLVFN
ncbi:hypothetical protein BC826DRAFT_903823 [Russula brevipes]|nr:hypothetical protein BC826DRAFT_903823 [Russula brevipes]